MAKKNFYAIARGRKKGILTKWFGDGGAYDQVKGFKGAVYKGFLTRDEAESWLLEKKETSRPPKKEHLSSGTQHINDSTDRVVIYTDGGSLNNPGPGGYGVVQLYKGERKEFSGAYRLTTNNRMELTACIVALRELTYDAPATLHSDSKYVVDGITKGWAKRWKKNNWMRTKTEKALNADLWAELLDLCERHEVTFRWVKGHAGVEENERCDFLVNQAQAKGGLPPDINYEKTIKK
jgi:ribonuclease HI